MSAAIKLLIIEDDEVLSTYMIACLSKHSFDIVKLVESGEEALSFLQKNAVDLIISDINLSGQLSGVDVANILQKDINKNLPIIFISASFNSNVMHTNPYGYLLKPFKVDDLRISIEIAMHRFSITEKLCSYQAHLKQAQQLGNMGSWEWDIITNDISWTDQIYLIFGFQPQQFEPTYSNFLNCVHPDDQQQVIEAVNNAVENNHVYDIEHRIITPDGIIRYVHEIGEVSYSNKNIPIRMIGTVIDISERKLRDEELKYMAFHDSLTSLPNRALLMDRFDVQLATATRNAQEFAVMFIDLDKFKPINDNYGHKAGDLVLQTVAKRLLSLKRDTDTLARIGGDEFIILIPEAKTKQGLETFANKILTAIQQDINILDKTSVNLSASIGIAIYPENGKTIQELLKSSDSAMYKAKKSKTTQVLLA